MSFELVGFADLELFNLELGIIQFGILSSSIFEFLNFNYEIDILYIIRISCGGNGMLVHVVQEFAQVGY